MNKNLSIFSLSITLLILPAIVFAAIQSVPQPSNTVQNTPINVLTLASNILGFLWPLFIGAVIIMLVFAGFMFVTANGDPTKIATAKKAVIWAVVGIIVAIVAYSAYGLISNVVTPTPVGACDVAVGTPGADANGCIDSMTSVACQNINGQWNAGTTCALLHP